MEQVIQKNGFPMLSVVIPAYNEEHGIANIVKRVLSVDGALKDVGICMELIVVDDGSADKTSEVVSSFEGVRLVRHPKNRGYGAAIKTGFQASRGDFLAFLDADGTYPPEFFPKLCQAALGGADLVVGSRRSGEKSEMPFVRQVGNFIWSNLLSLIGNSKVNDPASGMRIIRREALEKLLPLPDGLNFTPVMSTRAVHEDLKMVEIAIPYKERIGRSKLSVVRDGIRFLQTILWTALNYNPVRILGGIGIGLFVIAAVLAAIVIGMRISGITELGPWGVFAVFLAVVLVMAGVDIFALGIVFNYLVSLFHKSVVRQGLFGKPIFKTPLDRHFWWIGIIGMLAGLLIGLTSLILSLNGWAIERLWLYLLSATMMILVGFQLEIFWVVVRVLDELSQRDSMVQKDLNG